MVEVSYDGSLKTLFALLESFWRGGAAEAQGPRRVRRQAAPTPPLPAAAAQGSLFDDPAANPAAPVAPAAAEGAGNPLTASRPPAPALLPDPAMLEGAASLLYQISVDAYDALVYAWMSELPIEAPALCYALRVLWAAKRAAPAAKCAAPAAKRAATPAPWYATENARTAAARAALDRGDGDCRTVLAAAHKVAHEINRLMGFLRFSPDTQGRYIARCAPDHNVLPALAPHFTRRFGDSPWVIIDERRGLALVRDQAAEDGEPGLFALDSHGQDPRGRNSQDPWGQDPWGQQDPWEDLWRSYHHTINIESRKNPRLQRQFVPLRYRPYLNEFDPLPDNSGDPEL